MWQGKRKQLVILANKGVAIVVCCWVSAGTGNGCVAQPNPW